MDISLWYYLDMYRRFKLLIVILSAALFLNGCILERIFRVKNQLCDFDRNFQIEISEGFRVLLREPVMLDEDITWLAGAQPSEQQSLGEELVMTYIAERKGGLADGRYDLPIELRFVRLDGEYRLKEGYLSKNLTDMLTDELLTQLMQSVCRSEKSLVKQRIIIDISTLDRSLLPAKSEVTEILGPPNPNKGISHTQIYDYQLKNHDNADTETAIEIKFDDTNHKIQRIKVKYLRYKLDADFDKGEAILSVDIFDAGET
jgi:hypothetical protein